MVAAGRRSSTSPARSRPHKFDARAEAGGGGAGCSGGRPRPPRASSRRSRPSSPTFVIDSIQTIHSEGITGAPGGRAGARSRRAPRRREADGIAVILVGHVTKEGAVAGPRVLEHLVDGVLYFEGERERGSASCARSRTALARPARSASSRCGARPRRGRGPVGAVRRGGGRGARLGRPVRDGGDAAAACGGPGLVAPTEIVPPRRVGTGSTATAWPAPRRAGRHGGLLASPTYS